MFQFQFEPKIPLLTATRTGFWSIDTVNAYEKALRPALAALQMTGRSTSFIIDIRSSGAQDQKVAKALKNMVERLGPLHADRTAVVTSSGIAKLQAKRVADVNAQVFTSMVLARDWVMAEADRTEELGTVRDEPSDVAAEGVSVHIHGPSDVDVRLTPEAALETAKRIGDVAVEVVLARATAATRQSPSPAPL